jgi:hypothetical protein
VERCRRDRNELRGGAKKVFRLELIAGARGAREATSECLVLVSLIVYVSGETTTTHASRYKYVAGSSVLDGVAV